jgi:hypothetical protein
MAKTPECKVKDEIKKLLKSRGIYYTMPIGGAFSTIGVPDFLCCYKGRFIGIEAKAGSNKPTALQEKNLEDIRKAGGVGLVINEKNLIELINTLKEQDDER